MSLDPGARTLIQPRSVLESGETLLQAAAHLPTCKRSIHLVSGSSRDSPSLVLERSTTQQVLVSLSCC